MASRRKLLKTAALAFFASPLLRQLAQAQQQLDATRRQRLIVMFTELGYTPHLWSQKESGSDFILKTSLLPLQDHKQEMLILENLSTNKTMAARTKVRNLHHQGFSAMFTGSVALPSSVDGKTHGPWGPSIDHLAAQVLHDPKVHNPVHFGVQTGGAVMSSRTISWAADGKPEYHQNNPGKIFDQYFAGLLSDGNASEEERAQRLKKSVIDDVYADLQDLMRSVDSETKKRLEADLESFRQVEKVVIPDLVNRPKIELNQADYQGLNPSNKGDRIKLMRLQMKLMVAGFKADLFRVSTLQVGYGNGGTNLQWMPRGFSARGKHWHGEVSHRNAGNGVRNTQEQCDTWTAEILAVYAEVVNELIHELKSIPEVGQPDRSLWDNTTLLWASEMGRPEHKTNSCLYTLFGSAGGVLKTGQHLILPPNTPTNQAQLTLLRALGHKTPSFGFPEVSGGKVISEMLASA